MFNLQKHKMIMFRTKSVPSNVHGA
jgi:hypothetical protein